MATDFETEFDDGIIISDNLPIEPPRKYSVWEDRKQFYFDRHAAYNVVRFFEENIVHVKGPLAGQTIKLERWQRRFLRRLYGWKRRDDHTRRYRQAFLFVPRKNGKSFLGAGCALYGLVADNEMGAECVSAAVDRDQAKVIFDVAKQIVLLSPRLSRICVVYSKTIVVHRTASKYSVLSADVENKHGSNPSTIIFDELHTQPNGDLVEVLETGTGARAQPLTIFFTTAGHDRTSVCYEYYQKAKAVTAEPWRDPTFLALVYEATEQDNWKDPKVWRKANPNYGVSVIPNNFERAFKLACENRRLENAFKRLYLNIWTEQEERWLPMDEWDACANPFFVLDDVKDLECIGGLDLSSKIDITAFVLIFRQVDGRIFVIPFFWMPAYALRKRAKKDSVPYEDWVKAGYITTTPGKVINYSYIRKKIKKLSEIFRIKEIGFDPWRAEQLALKLTEDGFTMVELIQNYKNLSEPCRELEALLQANTLRHNGNPVLRWMASNVAVDTSPDGAIKPSRKQAKQRIDGISALINALNRLIVSPGHKRSKYEDEGLFST